MLRRNLSEAINEARRKLQWLNTNGDMTQRDLADALETYQTTVWRWLNNPRSRIEFEHRERIAVLYRERAGTDELPADDPKVQLRQAA